MSVRWEQLRDFPKYEVSDQGEFVNARTDRSIRSSRTQQGHAKVTLSLDGRLTTRSVALLVAETFIPQPEEHFDTPIHLNGDLMDCSAANLMWRPRWFAIRYHRQFHYDMFHLDEQPRIDLNTGEEYGSLKEVCTRNGVYFHDVIQSCMQGTFVPITYQEFREVS